MSFAVSLMNEYDFFVNTYLTNIVFWDRALRFARSSIDLETPTGEDNTLIRSIFRTTDAIDYAPFGSPTTFDNSRGRRVTGVVKHLGLINYKVRMKLKSLNWGTPTGTFSPRGYLSIRNRQDVQHPRRTEGYMMGISVAAGVQRLFLARYTDGNEFIMATVNLTHNISNYTIYYFQIEASGNVITARLLDANLNVLNSVSAVDATYSSGGFGVFSMDDRNSGFWSFVGAYILNEANEIGDITFPRINYYDSGETGEWHLTINFPRQDSAGNSLTFEVFEADSSTGLNSQVVPPIISNTNVYNMSKRYIRIIIFWNRGSATAEPIISSTLNLMGLPGNIEAGTPRSSSFLLPF